jgi:hypothetical protein
MVSAAELIAQGKKDEIWARYCGFLDFKLDKFMGIQKRLLMEHVRRLGASPIGQVIFGDLLPQDVDDFRENVPLTNYEIYAPYLDEQREDVLPPGHYRWAYTSGRTSLSGRKWAPIPDLMYDRLGEGIITAMLLSSCREKGDVCLKANDSVILTTAPLPYISALLSHSLEEQMDINFFPPLDSGEQMQFEERINKGFDMATEFGLDYFFGLSSILAKIGEMFEFGSESTSIRKYLKPRVLPRMLKGMIKSKIDGRKLFPRDIWSLKGIMTTGTDTTVYKEKIERYWGKKPLEAYICTEGGGMATQAWTYYGLNFLPDINFIEFIPYEEYLKNKLDPNYRPSTLLLDELQQGIYEIVFTNLLGGVFTRYRIGDLFEVIALRDEEAGIDLPQFRLYARTNTIIDIGGIARVTEMQITQSIEHTGLKYVDWVARKEEMNGETFLNLYLELKEPDSITPESLNALVREGMLKHVPEFPDLEELLGKNHMQVTCLAAGSWSYYMDFQNRVGADLAHVKPPHIQPSDAAMRILLELTRRQ